MRSTRRCLGYVYLQISDSSKIGDIASQCRRGVGFNVKFDLGPGVDKLEVGEFRRRFDDYMKVRSDVYDTITGGKVMTHMYLEVQEVHANCKYIVSGKMRGGYVRQSHKYGAKVAGHMGGKVRNGTPWAGNE